MSKFEPEIQQLSFESTEDLGKRKLQIKTGPIAEVIVIDGSYKMVGRNVGGFSKKLPVGTYEVKVRVGDEVESRMVTLEEDLQEIFTVGDILTPSPAPVNPSEFTDSVLQEYLSFFPEAPLKLAIRRREGRVTSPGFTLTDPSGSAIRPQRTTLMDDSMLVLAFPQARPGAYHLSVGLKQGGRLNSSFWVAEDFQTQVFMYQQAVASIQNKQTIPDHASQAVNLLSKGISLQKARKSWQLTESARATLGLSTRVAPLAQTQEALSQTSPSPMLALLGCHHLVWLQDNPNAKVDKGLPTQEEMAQFVKRLEELLPGCPDVEALKCRVLNDTSAMLAFPPMLHLSWSLLMPQSNTFTLPTGQYRDQAGSPITTHRPWLVWQSR